MPFSVSEIKWDPSWPADKRAYYNARKELSASTAKEERIQQMADDARRKADQLASMLSRMDAKDKQITDLIAQVTSMNTQRRRDDSDDDKPSRK